EPERAALARNPAARRGQLAAHGLGEATADRQAQPRPAVPPRDRGVELAEGLEQEVHPLWRDADARIADLDLDGPRIRRRRRAPALDGQHDLALLGELDR